MAAQSQCLLLKVPDGKPHEQVCETGKDRVVLNSRKGIIKYCLQP